MSTHQRRVDYDDIASTYDARYGSNAGEAQHTIPPALRELLRQGVRNRILEVGCGTGFWFDSFGSDHEVFGIDFSQGMLRRAKLKQTNLICGTADLLPFIGDSFEVVYSVNALHHFVQKEAFIREAARVCDEVARLPSLVWIPMASVTGGTSTTTSRVLMRRTSSVFHRSRKLRRGSPAPAFLMSAMAWSNASSIINTALKY